MDNNILIEYGLKLMSQNKHLSKLLREFNINGNSNINSIFQTMITVEIEESENLTVDVESYKGTSKFDLSILSIKKIKVNI